MATAVGVEAFEDELDLGPFVWVDRNRVHPGVVEDVGLILHPSEDAQRRKELEELKSLEKIAGGSWRW